MTERTPADAPIDRAITRAIDDAESTVPEATSEDLLAAARTARDHDTARRRRTVRIVTGAAAAVILIVAAVAIAVNRRADDTNLAADKAASETTNTTALRPAFVVDPSVDLVDGQTVTVTVVGGAFDPGTPVSAMQCASNSTTTPACDGRTRTSFGPMPADGGDVSGPLTVFAESFSLGLYRFDETTGSWSVDPTVGASPPVSCAAVTSSGHATARADGSGPGNDEPVAPGHDGDGATGSGSAEPGSTGGQQPGVETPGGESVVEPADPGTSLSGVPPTTMAEDDPGFEEPCMIAVFGISQGRPRVAVAPISFAPIDGTEPGTRPGPDDDSTASPVQPFDPDEPTTPPAVPSDVSGLCPAAPDYEPFTGDPGPAGPLVGFVPDQITICAYEVTGEVRSWNISSFDIERLVDALNSLDPASRHQECTMEMGPRVALIATAGDRRATVWLEFYGCGIAHSGDRYRTGAGTLPMPIP